MVHNDKVLEDVNALLDYNAVKDYLFMTSFVLSGFLI